MSQTGRQGTHIHTHTISIHTYAQRHTVHTDRFCFLLSEGQHVRTELKKTPDKNRTSEKSREGDETRHLQIRDKKRGSEMEQLSCLLVSLPLPPGSSGRHPLAGCLTEERLEMDNLCLSNFDYDVCLLLCWKEIVREVWK